MTDLENLAGLLYVIEGYDEPLTPRRLREMLLQAAESTD